MSIYKTEFQLNAVATLQLSSSSITSLDDNEQEAGSKEVVLETKDTKESKVQSGGIRRNEKSFTIEIKNEKGKLIKIERPFPTEQLIFSDSEYLTLGKLLRSTVNVRKTLLALEQQDQLKQKEIEEAIQELNVNKGKIVELMSSITSFAPCKLKAFPLLLSNECIELLWEILGDSLNSPYTPLIEIDPGYNSDRNDRVPEALAPFLPRLIEISPWINSFGAISWVAAAQGFYLVEPLLKRTDSDVSINLRGYGLMVVNRLESILKYHKSNLLVSGNWIDDNGAIKIAEAIASNPSFKNLNINRNNVGPVATAVLAEVFAKHPTFSDFSIADNPIMDEGVTVLCNAYKTKYSGSRKQLSLNFKNTKMGPKSLATIERQIFPLNVTSLSLAANPRIAESKNMGFFSFLKKQGKRSSTPEFISFVNALKQNKSIHILDLSSCKLGDEEAELLAEMLAVNTTLQVLNLEDNQIGDVGIKFLGDAIKKNKNLALTSLNLKRNNITDVAKEKFKNLESRKLRIFSRAHLGHSEESDVFLAFERYRKFLPMWLKTIYEQNGLINIPGVISIIVEYALSDRVAAQPNFENQEIEQLIGREATAGGTFGLLGC